MRAAHTGKTIMLVEVTSGMLRLIRSSGIYTNLSGHDVDYIAFLANQGTFVAEVHSMQRNIPLNKVHPEMESAARTTAYRIGHLRRHTLRRNSKIPRGRKRMVEYGKFMEAKDTSELFRNRYH